MEAVVSRENPEKQTRDNENAFFWKRSSVNRALKLWQQKNVFYFIYIYNHIKSSKNTPGGVLHYVSPV